MVLFQALLSKVNSRKDKTYSISFETQELSGQELAPILDYNGSFVNVLIIPDDPTTVAKVIEFLNAQKDQS